MLVIVDFIVSYAHVAGIRSLCIIIASEYAEVPILFVLYIPKKKQLSLIIAYIKDSDSELL